MHHYLAHAVGVRVAGAVRVLAFVSELEFTFRGIYTGAAVFFYKCSSNIVHQAAHCQNCFKFSNAVFMPLGDRT